MNNLFKNKYRNNTTRLDNYNYSQTGYYFITICTDKRKIFFGNIENGKMKLNKLGIIVKEELLNTSKIRKNVSIDKWVIMPNHLHVIIVINNENELFCVERPRWGISGRQVDKTPQRGASTGRNIHHRKEWKSGSLGVIINQFKGTTTKRLHLLGYKNFKWQANYYDHIIRNEQDYNNIWDYIDYNPDKWAWDRNNPNYKNN